MLKVVAEDIRKELEKIQVEDILINQFIQFLDSNYNLKKKPLKYCSDCFHSYMINGSIFQFACNYGHRVYDDLGCELQRLFQSQYNDKRHNK